MRPIAACAMIVEMRTRVSQVTPESPGIPRAMVYGLLRALPGDRAFLPPSLLRSLLLKSLMPASGHQDHTASPSASGALVSSPIRVHRIPSRVRDDREPPLGVGRDGGGYKTDLGAAARTISEIPKFILDLVFCRPTRSYAARIFAMKRSSSSRSRALSLERLLAEFSTSSEAEPVSVAPRLTCMTLAAACWVPCATF